MTNEKDNLILTGIGASPGIAEGRVKIIKSSEDRGAFQDKDILVTKITDPSMVTLMRKAKAIVTDIGALTSHPAIVSREMGIPCVVATKEATTKLKDGQTIKVDGQAGEVFLSETEEKVNDKDYDDMLESYRRGFSTMDVSTFEIATDYSKLDPLIANSWTKKLLKLIREIKGQNLSNQEIGKLLNCPGQIRVIAYFDLFMVSLAKIPVEEKLEIGEFYVNVLKEICIEDPFAKDKKNLIHKGDEIKEIMAKIEPGSPAIARKLGQLVSACYHLSHSLYGDMNPHIFYENYGPYNIKDKSGKNYILVIKEFKNIRPVELWKDSQAIPFSSIRIVTVYEDVEFSVDAITHTNYKGDIINNLRHYSLEVDEKQVDINEIDSIIDIVESFSKEIWEKFKKFDFEKFKLLYFYQKAYNLYFLCQRLGIDWKLSQDIIDEMKNKPLHEWPKFDDPREADEFFLKIIDPRTDFSG